MEDGDGAHEIYLTQSNQRRCFLCNATPERFIDHIRDGSWTFCLDHMREIAEVEEARDHDGGIRAVQ